MKKKINETLAELLIGILLWGICWQLVGVWFVPDRFSCSLGLWIGTVLAALCSVHMYWALDRALDFGETDAQKQVMLHAMLRYMVIVIVFFAVMYTEVANPLTAFLGLIGLKAAAYMQPFIHKIYKK